MLPGQEMSTSCNNVIENAFALATSPLITEDLLHDAIKQHQRKIPPLSKARRQFEQQYLIQLLLTTNGNVSQTARIANRNHTDFCKLLNRYHIVQSLFKSEYEAKTALHHPFLFCRKIETKKSVIFVVPLK